MLNPSPEQMSRETLLQATNELLVNVPYTPYELSGEQIDNCMAFHRAIINPIRQHGRILIPADTYAAIEAEVRDSRAKTNELYEEMQSKWQGRSMMQKLMDYKNGVMLAPRPAPKPNIQNFQFFGRSLESDSRSIWPIPTMLFRARTSQWHTGDSVFINDEEFGLDPSIVVVSVDYTEWSEDQRCNETKRFFLYPNEPEISVVHESIGYLSRVEPKSDQYFDPFTRMETTPLGIMHSIVKKLIEIKKS